MRRVTRGVAAGLVVGVAAGLLAGGCGSGASSTIKSLALTKSISLPSISPSPSLTWLWILIGAVVVIGVAVVVIVARHFGHRSMILGGWLSRALDSYAQGSALHDAMSIAARPEALTAGDSGARWADVQRRADGFAQALYALRESAAEADDRARVDDVLAALQAVRSGMDAQRAAGGAEAAQAEVVRGRLLAFAHALRELRPSDRRIR